MRTYRIVYIENLGDDHDDDSKMVLVRAKNRKDAKATFFSHEAFKLFYIVSVTWLPHLDEAKQVAGD